MLTVAKSLLLRQQKQADWVVIASPGSSIGRTPSLQGWGPPFPIGDRERYRAAPTATNPLSRSTWIGPECHGLNGKISHMA